MSPSDPSSSRAYRILVVDDDPSTAEIVRSWYKEQPYRILEAADGESGLRTAAQENPDLILLDLTMPGIDGITVARRMQSDPRLRMIPVILLTACRDRDSKVEAFAAGVDDYIEKPFEYEETDARIRAMLRKREFLVSLESVIRDLTESNEQLEQLLMIDEKTGLFNFREFQKKLKEEWLRAERYEVPLSLVFLDLDHFKKVNDRLGHPAGDLVLREFATLVAGGARANDVAARYGGEEFAVILPHTEEAKAVRVAERIRKAVEAFVFLEEEKPTRITVSAGVATYRAYNRIDSVDELVRAADSALYAAKDRGRNLVVLYEDDLAPPEPTPEAPHPARRRT